MKPILTLLLTIAFVRFAVAVELPAETLAVDQWASLDSNAQLSGRIVVSESAGLTTAIAGASVALVGAADEMFQAKTDASGHFRVSGMKPGIYALSVAKKGFFACGAFQVVAADHAAASGFPTEPEFVVAKIDASMVKSSMIRYLPPTSIESHVGEIPNNELSEIALIAKFRHKERIVQHLGGIRGNIGVAGASKGRLEAAELMNVLVIQNGEEVARAITDVAGHFEIESLPLGDYSLVAVGPAGFGCVGFVVVDESEMTKVSQSAAGKNGQLVSQIGGDCCCAAEFGMQVAPMQQVIESVGAAYEADTIISDEVISEQVIDQGIVSDGMIADGVGVPVSGGGFVPGGVSGGGFGSSGAGGFGGGGGFGGIAGLGAIGAAIAIGASNNGGGGVIVATPAVSPSSF